MIQACIFDLDGVLVDTVGLHFDSWQKLTLMLGHQLPLTLKDKFRGASRMKSLNYILDHFSIDASDADKIKYCHLKNEYYQKSLVDIDKSIVLPGAEELLNELSKTNIKTALASASRNAKLIIAKLKLDHLFDAMVDATDVKETKPHPEVFLTAAERISCSPQNCIVFEDSPLGVQAAQTGGFMSIGLGKEINPESVDLHLNDLSNISWSSLEQSINNK